MGGFRLLADELRTRSLVKMSPFQDSGLAFPTRPWEKVGLLGTFESHN